MTKLQGTLFDDLPAYVGPVSKHPIYRVWSQMKMRCHNARNRSFGAYGARGIFVCDEWLSSSRAFVAWAIKAGYQAGLELDRKDNDGPYSPDNCRFVKRRVNVNNRRNTPRLLDGRPAWPVAQRNGVSNQLLHERLRIGWSVDRAATVPPYAEYSPAKYSLSDGRPFASAIRVSGLAKATVYSRLRCGWSIEDALSIPKGGKRPLPDGFQSLGDAAASVVAATVAKIAQGESEAATLGDQAQRSAARRKPKAKGNGHA